MRYYLELYNGNYYVNNTEHSRDGTATRSEMLTVSNNFVSNLIFQKAEFPQHVHLKQYKPT